MFGSHNQRGWFFKNVVRLCNSIKKTACDEIFLGKSMGKNQSANIILYE
jgi:hypothetical protein